MSKANFGKNFVVNLRSSLVFTALLFSMLITGLLSPQISLAYDVVAGGQSLGIVLKSEGAIVVGFTPVQTADGQELYPAKDAGVAIEDMLIAINDKQVSYNKEVADLIDELGRKGESVELTLRRDGALKKLKVEPALCAESGSWRIGLYIRDANAGIGTLTFYDPATGAYGALGHRVEDNSEGGADNLGRVLAAQVQYIQNSVDGEPGEKVGVFDSDALNGTINKNCDLGIYGLLDKPVSNELYPDLLPVAGADEVKAGPATILTVLEGETLEEFEIEISRVAPQKHAADKGMVIKITDERLLARAGGIVQGMSGSPIIQDGKLVGAVTHVFVNDASSGYACFAEWMLEEAKEL